MSEGNRENQVREGKRERVGSETRKRGAKYDLE